MIENSSESRGDLVFSTLEQEIIKKIVNAENIISKKIIERIKISAIFDEFSSMRENFAKKLFLTKNVNECCTRLILLGNSLRNLQAIYTRLSFPIKDLREVFIDYNNIIRL